MWWAYTHSRTLAYLQPSLWKHPWNQQGELIIPLHMFPRLFILLSLSCYHNNDILLSLSYSELFTSNMVSISRLFSSVQLLSRVRLFATPWIVARQASLSITNSQSWLRLMSIESVMLSSHLILCRPLLLLPSIPPRIRVFSNESALCIRWPKYWSFSISPSNEYSGLISFRID